MVVNIEHNEDKQKRKDYSEGNKKQLFPNKKYLLLSFLVISLVVLSGCLDNFFFSSKTIYESSPTQVSYKITYGYQINTTGTGVATVNYREYVPQGRNATIYFISLQPENQYVTQKNGNKLVVWNETIEHQNNHSFSVSAHIIQDSIIIADLSGGKSLTIPEIHSNYPNITADYTHVLGNKTRVIVDPLHPQIVQTVHTIKNKSSTDNAFLLGKELFSWLKNHTRYEQHASSQPQPAIVTYETGVGDCDDLTYLYLSLCRAAGLPSRYVKGYLVSNTSAVAHVWAEIFVGKEITQDGWIPVECAGTSSYPSEIHNHFGIEEADHLRLCVDDGTNETFIQLTHPIHLRYESSMNVNISRFESTKNFNILSSKELIIEENHRYYE